MPARFTLFSFLAFILSSLLLVPTVLPWQVPTGFFLWVPIGILLCTMLTQWEGAVIMKKSAHWQQKALENQGQQEKCLQAEAQRDALQTQLKEAQRAKQKSEKKAQLLAATPSHEAVHLLRLFQEEGRLLDFLLRDVHAFPDERIGAVARIVHQGCRRILDEYFEIAPVLAEKEGEMIPLPSETERKKIRVLGEGDGTHATILHRGWAVSRMQLPKTMSSEWATSLVVPAEVELRS